MQLEDFKFVPVPAIEEPDLQPFTEIDDPLGPLAALAGTWKGTGFNTIWRPHFKVQDRFLELNLTRETLEFEKIPGEIPNRGFAQKDINMFGLHYLQQISDRTLHAGIHLEPGIWATVPRTTVPDRAPTVVRMASIPHGTAVLAQGHASVIAGPPVIKPTDIIPFATGAPSTKGTFRQAEQTFPELKLSRTTAFRQPSDASTVPDITQAMVKDPNVVLTRHIADQDIVNTVALRVKASNARPRGVGTANTFFLTENAAADIVTSTFWIETVKKPGGGHFLQLQYTQTVMLDFNGLSWPHVSVATLRKQATTTSLSRDAATMVVPGARKTRETELT
ncbi:MAG TPA: heme-binding protein [Nocardioides sp.]|uniref:heme-binding protein n=1 Tax=Nocardioides sp. TaxID=35761 RepID=UPI002F3EA5B1